MDVILTLFGIAFVAFVVVAELRERERHLQREWMALFPVVVPPKMQAKVLAELAPLSLAKRVAVLRSILHGWTEVKKKFEAERDKVSNVGDQILFGDGTITIDELPNACGEFGLVPSNPIPCSFAGSYFYTAGLRALDGTKVICRRTGTVTSDVSPYLIDAYEVSHANGEKLATIYISPYQKAMSCRTPRGFRLG